ncbi:hypothetical protein B0H13DRAFT_1917664 [Mycena leptocephala]|nr:hypothetical protein B0H13DRAFT_1917664 [Mycena leptocephala]
MCENMKIGAGPHAFAKWYLVIPEAVGDTRGETVRVGARGKGPGGGGQYGVSKCQSRQRFFASVLSKLIGMASNANGFRSVERAWARRKNLTWWSGAKDVTVLEVAIRGFSCRSRGFDCTRWTCTEEERIG